MRGGLQRRAIDAYGAESWSVLPRARVRFSGTQRSAPVGQARAKCIAPFALPERMPRGDFCYLGAATLRRITARESQTPMIGVLPSSLAMDVEIRHAIDAVRKDVRQFDGRLSAEIRQVEARLRQEIREEGIATRRHIEAVAKSLRDEIPIIAQGLVTLVGKVEARSEGRSEAESKK